MFNRHKTQTSQANDRTDDRNDSPARPDFHGGKMAIPRSRGAVSGLLMILFGAWAAVIPLIGPYFDYAYGSDKAWQFTESRWWLQLLPGLVALVAGVVVMMSANRATASAAAWLGVAAGAWLVIGRDCAAWLGIPSPGAPVGAGNFLRTLESVGMFSGVGALIIFVGAGAVGRLSVRSVRDVRVAQKHERKEEARQRDVSQTAYEAGRRDEAREREQAMQQAMQQQPQQPHHVGPPPGYPNSQVDEQQQGLRY